MKKINVILLIACLLLSFVSLSVFAEPGEEVIEAKKGTPVIDGNIDDTWESCEVVKVDYYNKDASSWQVGDAYTEFEKAPEVRTMWDEENIYVLYEVTKDEINVENPKSENWTRDGVFFYLNQKSRGFGGLVARYGDVEYVVNADGHAKINNGDKEADVDSAVKKTEDGYVVEVRVAWDYFEPEEGKTVSAEFKVANVNKLPEDHESRPGVSASSMHHWSGGAWNNVIQYGTIKLVE